MIKSTITLQRKTICNCSAYPYPHAVGQGKCKESLLEVPPFSPPKRGLGAKLCSFIEDLESAIQDSEETEAIANLILTFKKDLYGDREAEHFQSEYDINHQII
jgi:hypothetical protein